MTDLEYLTDTLDSLGFYYTIKNPPQPVPTDAVCNLCVVLNTGLTVYKEILFYFKNEKFVVGSPSQPCNPKLIFDNLTEMIEDLLSVLTPDRKVTPGSKWKHFKGTIAEVITLCKHSETSEDLVVYITVLDIINMFPDLLHRAQNDNEKAKRELVGQCMRQSCGILNPVLVRQYIDNMEALVKAAEKEREVERIIQ